MRKVIKILLSTVSTIIITLIILPIVISLALQIPAIQNLIVRKTTAYLSRKAETTISIDRMHLQLFNRITLDGIYVEDYHDNDTLLYARQLVAPFSLMSIFRGEIELGAVRLQDPVLNLIQDSTGTTGLTQLLQRFKPEQKKESKKPFRLRASGIRIDNFRFRHRKLERVYREYGVNFSDLSVREFYLLAHNFRLDGDRIELSINNISFREQSGLEVDRFASRNFSISGAGLHANRVRLETPESELFMTYFNLNYTHWADLSDFLALVPIEAEIVNSTVSTRTLAYFVPSMRRLNITPTEISGAVKGTVGNMTGSIDKIRIRNSELAFRFSIQGLPDINNARFNLNIPNFRTNSTDIQYIAQETMGKPLEGSVLDYLNRADQIGFSGRFDGSLNNFTADGNLSIRQGEITMNLTVNQLAENLRRVGGTVDVRGFRIGSLLGLESFEQISLRADMSGTLGKKDIRMQATARIPQMTFNRYRYENIELKGLFENKKFTGEIHSGDPNILFDFNGEVDLNGQIPAYNFALNLQNADLYKLNFNKRDTVSIFRSVLTAKGSGSTLDNMNARISINEMTYINPLDTVRAGAIRLLARNDEDIKELALFSAFADVEFRARASYKQMMPFFRNTLLSYLPSIESEDNGNEVAAGKAAPPPKAVKAVTVEGADVRNFYMVRLNVKEANNVAGIFVPGLKLARGTTLSFLFNPEIEVFSLLAKSDYVQKGNLEISKLDIVARNQADSIYLFLRADEFIAGSISLPEISLQGGAKNNRINLAARFHNKENGTFAMLSSVSTLGRNPETGIPQVAIRINPSTFATDDQTWAVTSRQIIYDSTRLYIESFNIFNGPQRLSVSGTASANPTDTLRLRLQQFDLTPISRLVQFKDFRIRGFLNGYLDMTSVYHTGVLNADIRFDSIQINEIPFRGTTFESKWDFAESVARVRLTDTQRGDTLLVGRYSPNNKSFRVRGNFRKLELALLNPFLEDVLSDIKGKANISFRVDNDNPQQHLNLNGDLEIESLSTTVDFNKVPYTVRNARGELKDNVLTIGTPDQPIRVYDPNGNSAQFDMNLNLSNFRNLSYGINIRPNQLMVLNTTARDNELFYGTVFATGRASIRGNRAGVSMDISASTDDNSQLFMPLGNTTISEADFVVFETKAERTLFDSLSPLKNRRVQIAEQLLERQQTTGNVDIRMNLRVLPNASVHITLDPEENNVLTAQGNGALTFHINPRNGIFTINGDYVITKGSYLFSLPPLLKRPFSIAQGSYIRWAGNPMEALLNITAEFGLRTSPAPLLRDNRFSNNVQVECIIHLTDYLVEPTITFDVRLPNAEPELQTAIANAMNTQEMVATQFIWLLATQNFYSEAGAGANLNIGVMGGTVTGIEFLASQLSGWLSTDRFSLVPKYRPQNEFSSEELGLALSGEIIRNRLTVEAEGNYDLGGNANRSANTLSGLDVYLTYWVDPAGNLRLRAFTRTVDRFDENQGLQESGVGIIYRESFDTGKELAQLFKERFAFRKRRRERKEAKAAKAAEAARLEETQNGQSEENEKNNEENPENEK